MKTYTNKIYPTLGADGKPNGRIIRVWERGSVDDIWAYTLSDNYPYPGQIYITTLLPGCSKGPHLHMNRDSLFCCVRGSVRITTRSIKATTEWIDGHPIERHGLCPEYLYETVTSGVGIPSERPIAVFVPAGTPCTLYNAGHDEALVVNVSSEPYDASDEHEVLDWRPNG